MLSKLLIVATVVAAANANLLAGKSFLKSKAVACDDPSGECGDGKDCHPKYVSYYYLSKDLPCLEEVCKPLGSASSVIASAYYLPSLVDSHLPFSLSFSLSLGFCAPSGYLSSALHLSPRCTALDEITEEHFVYM